jgi:hypothetical protein
MLLTLSLSSFKSVAIAAAVVSSISAIEKLTLCKRWKYVVSFLTCSPFSQSDDHTAIIAKLDMSALRGRWSRKLRRQKYIIFANGGLFTLLRCMLQQI